MDSILNLLDVTKLSTQLDHQSLSPHWVSQVPSHPIVSAGISNIFCPSIPSDQSVFFSKTEIQVNKNQQNLVKVIFVTGQQNITVHNKAQNPHDSRSLWVSLGLSGSLRVAPGDRGQWYRFDERESSCAVSNATAVDSSFGGEAGAPALEALDALDALLVSDDAK